MSNRLNFFFKSFLELEDCCVNREIARICNRVGIERFTAHCFRDTFATRCIESGMNQKTLQENPGACRYRDNDESLLLCDGRDKSAGNEKGRLFYIIIFLLKVSSSVKSRGRGQLSLRRGVPYNNLRICIGDIEYDNAPIINTSYKMPYNGYIIIYISTLPRSRSTADILFSYEDFRETEWINEDPL